MKKYLNFVGSVLLGCYVVPVYHFILNYPQLSLKDAFLIIVLFLSIILGITGLFLLLFRDIDKVAFLLYGGAVVFWFSHPLAGCLKKNFMFFKSLSSYAWPLLFVFCLLSIFVLFFLIRRYPRFVENINKKLTIFVFALSGLLSLNACLQIFSGLKDVSNPSQGSQQDRNEGIYPNVYHILLDAHPNKDAMKIIGGTLEPFYNKLETLGFVTFPDSRSNYPATQWSVASMLSMDYLWDAWEDMSSHSISNLIGNSKVFEHFRQRGYNVLFSADNVMVKSLYPSVKEIRGNQTSNVFCSVYNFLCATPAKHVFEKMFSGTFQQIVQKNIENVFVTLKFGKVFYGAKMNVFYAHVLCPHEPVIFSKKARNLAFQGFAMKYDASYMLDSETHKAFCDNVYGIDNLILKFIKEILKQYETESIKPIIVLHSDHSILYCARNIKSPFITPDTVYGNLLALYVPDEWKQDAKDLKFINLYRWIFNHLFSDNFEYFKRNEQKQ